MSNLTLNTVFEIIAGTPLWAWGILAYLIFVGIKASQKHIVYLPKLFIIPAIFIGMQYNTFFSKTIFSYIAFLLIGTLLGFIIGKKTHIKILQSKHSIELPGNYSTLIILILFFLIKYIFGYLKATAPVTAMQYTFIEISISALFAGYMLGKALSYFYQFYIYKK